MTNEPLANDWKRRNTEYNGWKNYQTWNVALWINSDEGLNKASLAYDNYNDFAEFMWFGMGSTHTTDGVAWKDPELDYERLDEMLKEAHDDA